MFKYAYNSTTLIFINTFFFHCKIACSGLLPLFLLLTENK